MRRIVAKFPLNILIYLIFSAGLAITFSYLVAIGNSEIALVVLVSIASISLSLFIQVITTKTELTYVK